MFYLPTNLQQKSTIDVGRYTSPMDPMDFPIEHRLNHGSPNISDFRVP